MEAKDKNNPSQGTYAQEGEGRLIWKIKSCSVFMMNCDNPVLLSFSVFLKIIIILAALLVNVERNGSAGSGNKRFRKKKVLWLPSDFSCIMAVQW